MLATNLTVKEIVFDDGLGEITLDELSPTSWRLVKPFTYRSIIIPAGFITDGASTPERILLTTWGGHYNTAVLVHDWLYTLINRGTPHPAAPTRKDADAILYQIMTECGVNWFVRWSVWIAVRGFGGPGMRDLGVR